MSLTIHTYEPAADGRCEYPWVDSVGQYRTCNSRQRASVLHDDPDAEFRERHWHGGGDCMCFEDPEGPSYHDAMKANREGR